MIWTFNHLLFYFFVVIVIGLGFHRKFILIRIFDIVDPLFIFIHWAIVVFRRLFFTAFSSTTDPRILVYLPSLLVLIEDRLCCRVVNLELICSASDRISLQDKLEQLLASLVAHIVVWALAARALCYQFGDLPWHGRCSLRIAVSLGIWGVNSFLIHLLE